MWLVGAVGLGLMHSAYHWSFFLLGGYDAGTLGQIGGYYLARAGAQTPALVFVALFIGLSQFQRPVRAACLTTLAFHGIGTIIRLVRNPWSVAPNLNQSIPVLAELAQLIWLVALSGFCTWLFIWLANWLEAIRALRHFRQMPKPK